MTVLSETRERFLRAIVAKVPVEQIAEIHFFQPLKQAGVESGVAVVAAQAAFAPPANLADDSHALHARFTVYTAHYRLTLKGPDRGKWDASVLAEADAPLVTVDAVVRGVQRRSGDVEDAERMTGDDVRAVLQRGQAADQPQRQPSGQVT